MEINMKIKVSEKTYEEASALIIKRHKRPSRQSPFFRWLMKVLSAGELKAVDFEYDEEGMDSLSPNAPCLFLMNHSSFTDLQIVSKLLANRRYHIVCTNDGFVGKEWLMRRLGCIPTAKFITDINLVKSMKYCFEKLKDSVVMYPEASYSFDGTVTNLPGSLGKCIKLMNVPVVMIRTQGAFLRDPLYNNLQKRKCKVTARVKYLLSPEQIKNKSAAEINSVLAEEFDYDHFKEQYENGVEITENFRADGLERVLYKCPSCTAEGKMRGKGTKLTCHACSKSWQMLTNGRLEAEKGDTEFAHIPDWYAWERESVKREVEEGSYCMEEAVDILMLADMKSMYRIGSGTLKHTNEGFHLTGCDGALDFKVASSSTYSLYADYFWYEIGDVIAIGDSSKQFYCFPINKEDAIVAKARLATEEIYRLHASRK